MIATLQLSAQSYNYSYTDPCTGQLKSLSVPINGSVAISYYGQIQNFSAAELQNGTFANWTTSVYNEFGGNNPCATLVGLPTAINITQGTVYTTIGIINSLTTLADLTSSISSVADLASGTTNILGGTVGTIGNSDSSGDSNNSNSNGNGTRTTTSNRSTSNSGTNQTTTNTQSTSSSSQGAGGSTTQSGNSTSSSNNSNATGSTSSQSSISTPSQSNSTSVSQPTSTSNSNNSANVNTNSNGSNSTQSTSNSSNNVSPSTPTQGNNSTSSSSQVPGSSPVQNSATSSQSTEGGQTNITAGGTQTIASSNNSESGGSGGGGSKTAAQKESGGKPTVIASSDFVGFNFKDSDVTTGVKATGGYTSLRWDGGAAHGILADYTSANKGPNITVFQAWIKKKSTTLVSGTLTIGFEGYGSQYVTAAIGQVRPIKKVKVVYMATCSVGKVYKEAFIGTAVIVGGMYDFKITKRFDIKVMNLFVYAPYVSYLDDVVMKSPYVMIPSIGTNIGITKRFKFNINAGSTMQINDATMNYTITCGTRLML
jgi:hypothetical protein